MTTPTNRSLPPVLDERWNEDSPTAWPGNVPSRTQALEALRDRLICPLPLPGARRVREKLTPPEREAIQGTRFCPLLREATVVRWRLAAAADLLPAAGARRSAVALRALLIEVNQVLSALKAATSASPELALDEAGQADPWVAQQASGELGAGPEAVGLQQGQQPQGSGARVRHVFQCVLH